MSRRNYTKIIADEPRRSNDYYTGNAADTAGATGPSVTSDTRPTSSKIKESASGVKGLVAAAHGMGEMVRGNINAGVDRVLNDVC